MASLMFRTRSLTFMAIGLMAMSDFLNHASQNRTGSVREGKEVQKVLVNEKHGRRCASE